MNIKQIGKLLKKTVKKKVSYSISLLIVFLMTGEIAVSTNLNDMLYEKNKVNKYNLELQDSQKDSLIELDKGDFQVFFINQRKESGKVKERTEIEFSETIDALNKKYNITGNLGKNIWKDKLKYGGFAIDNSSYRDTIILQPKIEILNPLIPQINPEIPSGITIPELTLSELPTLTVSLSTSVRTITAPVIAVPVPPGGVSISVSTPSAVGKIVVTAPVITEPTVPAEKNVKIISPTSPEGYDPTIIKLPTAPSQPDAVTVDVSSSSISGSGANPSVQYYWWNGNSGVISQVSLKSGEYIINGSSGNFNVDVANYDAEAFSGTSPTGDKPENGTHNVKQTFFHTLLNVPYSYYGEDTKIVFNSNGAKLIDLESEGTVQGNLDDRVAEGLITSATRDRLKEYQTYTGIKGDDTTELLFVNKGRIEINGRNSAYLFTTSHSSGNLRTNYLDNEGTIFANGEKSVVYMHSPDTSTSKAYIYSNGPTGKIYVDGVGASLMQWAYGNLSYNRAAFVNEGTAEIRGAEAIALYMSNNSTFHNGHAAYIKKPIELLGDKSVGLVAQNTNIINEKNIVKFNIGKQKQTIAKGNSVNNIFTGRTNDPNLVEQAIGILMDNPGTTKTAAQIEIGEYSYGGIGIFGKNGTIEIFKPYGTTTENSSITISGGEKNIGIVAKGGDITFDGDISIKSGKKNQVAVAESGKTIKIYGNVTVGDNIKKIEDTVALYAKDSGTEIKIAKDNLSLNLSGNSTGIFAANQGSITANRNSLSSQPNIYIEGKIQADGSTSGLGIYASDGGKVIAKNTHIKVKDGTVGVVATGADSNIELSGGKIDYSGDGYAVYTSNEGTVNLSNGEIILRGKATALELDLNSSSNPITLAGAKIVVMSNDAVALNLKNIGTLNIGTLKTDIEDKLGGVTIVDGTEGSQVFDKYKIAAVDGVTLNIDAQMDKSDTNINSTGFFYYRRFLGQRLNLNVFNGINVKSEIDSSYAAEYFKGQVVGLEMSSSKSAASASDAQINLAAGSKVIADRTDAGAGAIGLYMNFGKIDIAATAGVEVEKGANTVNDKAVGVYAVNGSTVSNAGDIKVNGNQSIGILGMAYREQLAGTPIVDEFGTGGIFVDQGKINITNSGHVVLDGAGTIGIYAYNNNAAGANADAKVTNTASGIVEVGNSTADNATIGIYGEKTTISNLGTILVGSNGIAIYAKSNSEITDLGTLKLGSDGIGVMLDSTSDLTAANVNAVSNGTGTSGQTVIFYKGTGADNKAINADIAASTLNKGVAVYAEDMNITSKGALSIGTSGIGIFVKGTKDNTGYNEGNITLGADKTGAVGMYSKTANIANKGTINVNESSQIGMYVEGNDIQALNKGTINLNADKSTGIYLKGAYTELDGTSNIVFGGKSSIGVFGEKAKVKLNDDMTLSNANENKNTFVYGKDSRVEITAGKTVTVDGMVAAGTTGNKTVGIYLENAGTGSNFVSNATGKLNVVNEAVGLYSKGNNNLDVNVTATGDKATGVFIDGASEIAGTVTARGNSTAGAVGVYGNGGVVTVGAAGLTLNTDAEKGTGMYLTDGASAVGGTITVNNTAGTTNIGVYYSKGATSGIVTNKSDISLAGSESIGIYAGDGINLVNNSNITSIAGKSENIGSYVGGGSQLTSTGTITMNDDNSIGMYVEEGKGINSSTIKMNGTSSAPNKSVVGMVVEAKYGKTAVVENAAGGAVVAGANLGMYIAGEGNVTGENKGTITISTGTGVYVKDNESYFNGTGGTIKVTDKGLGIYLENTSTGAVKGIGTIELASGAVGVYGKNAKIDFEVNTSNNKGEIGVVAENKTEISKNITAGQGSIGIEILDNTVKLTDGIEITVGENGSSTSIAAFIAKDIEDYEIGKITLNIKDGIGIYLEEGENKGTNLTLKGTINIETGIGAYIKDNTSLITQGAVFNIKAEGTGIYLDGGTAEISDVTFDFKDSKALGIYNNGGKLTLGTNINAIGEGSIAATKNGDLISTGDISGSGEGIIVLGGTYDNGALRNNEIKNTGTIELEDGSLGIVAAKGDEVSSKTVTVTNEGNILVNSSKSSSVGIYSSAADIKNTGTIEIKENSIGIYAKNEGKAISLDNSGNIQFSGKNGIGIYVDGNLSGDGIKNNNISFTGEASSNTGIILENITSGTLNIGSISLGKDSIGIIAKNVKGTLNQGTVNIKEGNSSIGVVVDENSEVTLKKGISINVGKNGIGMYINGENAKAIIEDVSKITAEENGIILYSKNGEVVFSGNMAVDNSIGIVAEGGKLTVDGNANIIAKNGGVGIYIKESLPTLEGTKITLEEGRTDKYSTGIYYDGINASKLSIPNIEQKGNFTIGTLFNNSTAAVGGVNLEKAWGNQVGILAKGNSKLTVEENINVAGDKNIGIYGNDSSIELKEDIKVEKSSESADKSKSSIAAYLKYGEYKGNGSINIGDNSIGIYGEEIVSLKHTGNSMNIGDNALGIYGTGKDNKSKITVEIGNIAVGNDNALGIYGEDIHIEVNGDINIAAGKSVGIISSGKGDISYTGDLSISDKGEKEGSIGIYKVLGAGEITNAVGNWKIGNGGYGIYVQQAKDGVMSKNEATVDNRANMELGNSSIGIFSNGKNRVYNSGNIKIESSADINYDNTVGIYLAGGSTGENSSSGNIIVKCDRAIGVLVKGKNTSFENKGKIEIDNGGIGIIVESGGKATNIGQIIIEGTKSNDGNTTIGMAAYSGGTIINGKTGIITVTEGIGMYVSSGSYLENHGKINVVNGTGIAGTGNVINSGEITISGTGKDLELSTSADVGAITISPEGNITINDKYVSIGGTLTVDGELIVNGAYVDVTTNMPVFNAASVNGEINILPNFAGTGNGISYEIENFVTTALGGSPGDKIAPATSPLFVAKIVNDNDLVIVKRPYADITIGEQFDALDKGLDNILSNSNGIGRDAEILKDLNVYLEGLRGIEFERETSRTLSEIRGDIYSTIQGRMQDINEAFENSFSELESSYNFSKNSYKLGVINVDGDYKDSTLGIDDYDYNVKGFIFMKEKEGRKVGNKYGYTIGFAGTKFEFDDGGSKEDVYSLRAGTHMVNNLNENYRINLLSRIELGYNRHLAKRKIELNKIYENEADYNTYELHVNNKLSKNIYKDKTGELELYTNLDIEYGKVKGFTEDARKEGGLEVKVSDNDYLSTQLGVGIRGNHRIYINNNIALKASGEMKYVHEMGENYEGNKAKLKSGNEDYYKLITPEKFKEQLSGKIGLTLEKVDSMGITFEVEVIDDRHREDTSIKYGMRFNYKF
ncbi:autotransporter-associated N-terminal domain-containing protein [Fusobacterium sp. THCT1E2]